MNNHIVRETSAEMKAIAKNTLSGNWQKVFVGMFVFYIMSAFVPALLNYFMPGIFPTYYREDIDVEVAYTVGNLYSAILQGAFEAGLSCFFISFVRKRDIHPGYLFSGFEYFFKSFGLMFVMGLFILLWSMLFVIPGFIAAFRYSQAFYILADNPEKGIMQCINESKVMMAGNKGRYFYTNLSFFGWIFLATIPVMFVPDENGLFNIFALAICEIPLLFVLTYMNTTLTVFYELVSGNLKAEPKTEFQDDNNPL